jgi:hypothetical protein
MKKPYKAQSKLLGPCGPCCFINLTGIKGSPRKEIELWKIGRFKPFRGTMYTGFLEWGKRYNLPMQVFTTSNKIDKKMFKYTFKEKISKQKRKLLMNQAIKNFESQNKKFKDKIFLIGNIKSKLNSFLKEKQKAAVCLTVYNKKKKKFIPHWMVAYRLSNNKYYFLDSSKILNGYRILSSYQLSKAFTESKRLGFPPALVIISPTPHRSHS